MEIARADMERLLEQSEFRLFLFAAIQRAGMWDVANGHDQRDLAFFEGRRSLGLELLRMADDGQPDALRSPHALATLDAIIRTAMNPPPQSKEKAHGRQDRYEDIPE
jgi:hypothetical protein